MAKDYSKETSPRLLRMAINHEKDPARLEQAMARLETITPERDKPGLKGIRHTFNKRAERLGASQPQKNAGPSNQQQDALDKDIERAANGGTNRVYTKRLRERARKAGRTIPEGQGSFKKYPDETSSATKNATPTKLSHREKKNLRDKAHRGDAKALERLREFGKARTIDEQNYQNAANMRRDNRPPEGRWAASVRHSQGDVSSVVEGILDSTPTAIPDRQKKWVAEKAEHTYTDLVKRGTDPDVARRVAQGYADSFAQKQNPNEAAFLEKWNKKRNHGR